MTPGSLLGLLILLIAFGGWLVLLLASVEPLLWWVIRRAVAPLGLVRTAATLARLCRAGFQHDRRGGPGLAGALALVARKQHDERLATWLEGQLVEQHALGAAGVVAAGLVAASRGQRDAARDLMRNAASFEAEVAPPAARVVANEWLVADAAARGDWPQVMRLGVRPDVASAQTRFLAFAAARIRREPLIGEPSATDIGMRWLWLLTPDHRRTRPLLRQALATPRVMYPRKPQPKPTPAPPPLDPAEFAGDPVAYAQALHALWGTAVDLERSLTPGHLVELCRAWDAAFAGSMLTRLTQRSQALTTVTTPDAAAAQIRRTVSQELADLGARAQIPLTVLLEAGGVGAEAGLLLRAELLGEVEKLSQNLRSRTQQKRGLPAVEELREWNTLRRAHERAATLGGLEVRRLMFPDIHLNVCNYAVWLWNDRKEYGISGPLFRWLLAEAEAVGDEEAIVLQRKNVGVK
jgi:hypothetical protein